MVIYQYIVRDEAGRLEIYRTVHKGNIPEGFTLLDELCSVDMGEFPPPPPSNQREKPWYLRLLGL